MTADREENFVHSGILVYCDHCCTISVWSSSECRHAEETRLLFKNYTLNATALVSFH